MGYAVSDSMVRVSEFKLGGKWVADHAVDMEGFYNEPLIHDAVEKAYRESGFTMWADRIYVCLEPYHKNAHPVMLKERGRKS